MKALCIVHKIYGKNTAVTEDSQVPRQGHKAAYLNGFDTENAGHKIHNLLFCSYVQDRDN